MQICHAIITFFNAADFPEASEGRYIVWFKTYLVLI